MDEHALLELCRYIIATGQKQGASAIEVQAVSLVDVEAEILQGEISGVNRRMGDEIAIRLYMGRRMGSAFTNIATEEAVREAVSIALSSAKVTTEDEDWVAFPEPASYKEIKGLWSDSVAKSEPAKVVEIAGEFMEKACELEKNLIPAFGGSGVGTYRTAYANSNGVAHTEKGTQAFAALGAIAQIEGGVTPMVTSIEIRRDMNLDLARAVDDITATLRTCTKTAEGKTGKHKVILHPSAYGQILNYTLIESVKGDNVARGKSKLAERIGEEIASDLVSISDDRVNPRGANSSVADSEGVPSRRTPIIEEGVLRSFLWDTYWANKTGEESTGNARRNMRRGLVEIAPTNIVVEPGRRDIKDIVSEIDHGYIVRGVQGAHSSNPESGDFSVVGNPAILVEDGEMVGAVHGLMVSGNVFELLNQVVEMAETPLILQGLIGPEIVFDDVNVIARG